MSYQQKPNNWAMFPNKYKKEPKHPDWKGDATVVCQHCQRAHVLEMAGWDKEGNSGSFLSGTINAPRPKSAPKENKQENKSSGGGTKYPARETEKPGAIPASDPGFDDDIPF